ncbi:MAG: hypothetical protein WBW94_09535 [Anaerolineales bacterium]
MEGIFGCMVIIFALAIAIILGIIVVPVGYLIARGRKTSIKPISVGLLAGMVITVVGFCVLSWFWLSQVLAGPPSPFWKPSQKDIIGIWHLTDDTQNYLKSKGYVLTENTLEFREDGTYRIINEPSVNGGFTSSNGTWKINGELGSWSVVLKSGTGQNDFFLIYSKNLPYLLYQPWAELSDWIFYERQAK